MAFSSVFAFFVASHLVILHTTGQDNMHQHSCPQSFNCGNLGQIKFPLYDTKYRRCGLCRVNCSEPVPKINLGMQQRYDVMKLLNDETIEVSDKRLRELISSKSCEVFRNLTLPNRPSISFTIISPNLTLFKCNTSSSLELHQQAYDYFRASHSFGGCLNYTIYYYTYPNHHVQNTSKLPRNCEVIQLPVVPTMANSNASDLFSLLADEFSIGLHVSNACRKCHLNGGQCRGQTEFQCGMDEKQGKINLKLILGTVVGVSVAGILIAVVLLYCFGRYLSGESMLFWKKENEFHQNVEAILKNCGALAPKRYSYLDVKKMTNSFKEKLGQGGYGGVYKGKLKNGCPIAVKVLNESKGNGEEFINEVASISRTSHINVVTLLGFCFEGHKRALIYEFMPNGSLEKFVYDVNSLADRQLGWETLYQIALGIARGLEYLHRGCNTRILHFDIKPHNILLDEDFCPKISDFGLAKLCPKKESIISMSGTRGTIGYIAPEVFYRSFGGVSHKSDVYSYGMMIIEMIGARKNVHVGVDHTSEIYFPEWIYRRLELDEKIGRLGIMKEEDNRRERKMMIVGLWCVQIDPFCRPAMSRVVDMLEGSLESLQIPPRPFLSSPPRAPADSSSTNNISLYSSNVC